MVKSEVELLLKYEMKSLRFHDENYKEVDIEDILPTVENGEKVTEKAP